MAPTLPALNTLAQHPQWVCWRREERGGKATKVPYNARTGMRASSTDPSTWSTYAEAEAAASLYDGLGFVLTEATGIVGVDLDHCLDLTTRAPAPWARDILACLDSYAEITPSTTGLRIFAYGALPKSGRKKGNVEIYAAGRFLTVTGRHLEGTPERIERRADAIAAVHAEVFGPETSNGTRQERPRAACESSIPPNLDDAEILRLACVSKHGARFEQLWAGDWQPAGYASQSEADLSLCDTLAFYTGRDEARIDRLFRQSGLMRDKWDEQHFGDGLTYGQATIAKAIEGTHETYTARDRTETRQAPPTLAPAPPPTAQPLEVPDAGMLGLGREFAELYSEYLESPRSFFYFAFLTYFGALISRKVMLASELRCQPRLYTVLLGESADTRKSTALVKTDEFFRALGSPWEVPVLFGLGSAEGLAAALNERPGHPLLLHYDELKSFVDKAKNEHSVALPMVSTLFERGDYDNRTKAESLTVRDASLSLVAACTVDTYATMFDQRFLSIGFLNRLWLVYDRARARIPIPRPIPMGRLEALRQHVRERLDAIDLAWTRNGMSPVPVPLTPLAERMFGDWYTGRGGSIFERRLDTYGHRLAVLIASNSGRDSVDETVMAAVIALLGYQLDVRRESDPVDAENAVARMEESIRRALARGRLSDRDLKRRVHYNRYGLWVFETATRNLLRAGEIHRDTKGRDWWLAEAVTTYVTTPKNGIFDNDSL